jgi:two-component system cell cycle sensor histidine kinase/response regulator CckA
MQFTPTRPIRVLHLEDNPRDAEIIGHKLKTDGVPCEISLAGCQKSFDAALAREPFDLILCDYNLPDYDAMTALKRANEIRPDAPVIVISGTVGEDEAVKCLQTGATDYLLKERLERLGPAVRRALREAEERRRRTLAEEAVLQRERRLSSIYDTVADVLFYVEVEADGGFRFVSVNRAFLSTTGLQDEQVVGKRVEAVIPPSSLGLVLEHCNQAIRERTIVRWEETSDYPKRRLTGEVSVAPVFDANGNCTHLVGSVHDVTERRTLEAQLRQAQKMESVGQLAGGIAHDFNNLLTVINGMSELALTHLKEDQQQLREDLGEIRRSGERAAALTRQLLAFSRKQILQPQFINLDKIVAEMGSMLRRLLGEDVDLVMKPSQEPATVKTDPGQIEQVIANLAVNARDAMPRGGRLTIETMHVDIDEEFCRQNGTAGPPGSYVVLALTDTGIGMDEATRRQMFEPFFTTKAPGKGTGLGLSTVYGIVKQSGGFILAQSEVGHGSCFTIHLPLVSDVPSGTRARSSVALRHGNETVLIVEDVIGLRRLIARTLESAGYNVLTAATGDEALRLLEQYENPVHLMVTDVVMPGMSGRDLAERLEQIRPGMKVLYMSGYTDDVIVRHGILEEKMPFVSKPFGTMDLLRTIRDVLDDVPTHP